MSNVVITEKITKAISQTNDRNLASTTHISPTFKIFCFKIEVDEKMK